MGNCMKYRIVEDRKDYQNQPEFIASSPRWNLSEVVLSPSIAEQIEEVTCFVEKSGILFDNWEFSRFMKDSRGITINFYGPPGTGKTITAEAVAGTLRKKIIRVNYADIESKYLGETSKNLQALFDNAMTTDSVLFFDEADAILSRRIANVSHAADYGINTAKSTLLTLLDSFSTVTIFATNLFENYDSAFLRRILFHISFPMPGVDQRTKLWELHLPEKIPKIITYRRAAELSEGLSGGDIRNLSIKLALQILTNRIATVDEASLSAQLESYQRTGRVHQTRVLGAVPISGEEMCTS